LYFTLIKHVPTFQWETPEARQWVAEQLGLPYNDGMQDWPWQVADEERLEDYLQLYARAADAERVVIMELLLQAATMQPNPEKLHLAWVKIEPLLDQNADLHASTAQYWCVWGYKEQDLDVFGFSVSPYVRTWWIANYPMPNDLTAS
jgi:hypothetical protein